jgi:copper resistance protein D
MIEVLGALFRWLQLASNMILIGGCVFLAIAWRDKAILEHPWLARLERSLAWLSIALLLGLLGLLATTTAQATGVADNLWRPGAWLDLLQKTRIGSIWMARAALALLVIGTSFALRAQPKAQWRYLLCAATAIVTLTAGSLSSHSAADEQSVLAILPYAVHLILASVWFGALPGFLLTMFVATEQRSGADMYQSGLQALKRFSAMALPVMAAIIITGILVTDRMVGSAYAALAATKYGWLLSTKLLLLAVILAIAARAHFAWLPALARNPESAEAEGHGLRKWITIEFFVATVLVFVATVLANAVPAKHAVIDDWPYSFRFSIAATWGDPDVMLRMWTGVGLLVLASSAVSMGYIKQWQMKWRIAIPATLASLALLLGLNAIATQAYPETYRKTPVPFDAISISNGIANYQANCVPCHGPQAKGNGVLAKTFAKPPVDLLTEPHTAKHTAGDFFHWLTYGIPGTGMPAWAEKLSEEDRWDIVNFLHALSRGYQARIIKSTVLPDQPYMAPQNFSYSTHDGSSGTLKDFRRQKALMLVLFSWPDSRERLETLRSVSSKIGDSNTMVLAVPINELTPQDLETITATLPFPVVTQGAPEIARSYSLFRRTIANPDLMGEGMQPKHMEFLIDRYGYLRARWIPEIDGAGWTDPNGLIRQIEQLNREKEILPPPDDHVH